MNELMGDNIRYDKCSHIRLVYLYSSQSESSERSRESVELIPLVLDEFGIRGQYYFINVTDDNGNGEIDLDDLEEFMSSHRRDIVLLVSALGSDLTYSTVQYLDSRGYTNYLMLNSFSTLDNAVLNRPRVVRVVPRDGTNALLFKALLDRVNADRRLLLVDESNRWARGLANSIQSVTNDITRYNLRDLVNGTAALPSGTLSIIALAEPATPLLMQLLSRRTADVRQVLLGDGDNSIRPDSINELQALNAWNTRMIVPKVNTDIIDEFIERTGYTKISNSLGPLVSVLQLAAYLKYALVHDSRLLLDSNNQINALHLLPAIRNYYMGIELDQLTMDVLAATFDVVSFSSIGLPATNTETVGVSQVEDDDIRMYLGQEVRR